MFDLWAAKQGYLCTKPVTQNQQGFDRVVDFGFGWLKVQIKTCRKEKNRETRRVNVESLRKYKDGDYDVLAVVDQDAPTPIVYLFNWDEVKQYDTIRDNKESLYGYWDNHIGSVWVNQYVKTK